MPPVNAAYFASLANRANAAANCSELKLVYHPAVAAIGETITQFGTELASIQQAAVNLATAITDLGAHLATLAGSQAAATALTTLPASAAGLVTLGSVITFLQAQATIVASFGGAINTTWIQEAISIAQQVATIQYDYNILQNKITALEAQIAQVPALLSAFEATCQTASLKFDSCTL